MQKKISLMPDFFYSEGGLTSCVEFCKRCPLIVARKYAAICGHDCWKMDRKSHSEYLIQFHGEKLFPLLYGQPAKVNAFKLRHYGALLANY